MAFMISADFLLGTYQGRDGDGRPERYPSMDRVYKALVATAYAVFGFRSGHAENCRFPYDDSALESALRWMEGNPPTAIYLPQARDSAVSGFQGSVVYRNKGYRDDHGKGIKVAPALAVTSSSFNVPDGVRPLTWQWEKSPDRQIAELLDALCHEVPYLGEAVSAVHLRTGFTDEYPLKGSYRLVSHEPLLEGIQCDYVFSYPGQNRLEELNESYQSVNPAKRTKPTGKEKEGEKNLLADYPSRNTERKASYSFGLESRRDIKSWIPWPNAILIPVTKSTRRGNAEAWRPDSSEYVHWAVALHKLLVRQWDGIPPSCLTGKYVKNSGIRQPANNISIQLLSPDMGSAFSKLSGEVKRTLNHNVDNVATGEEMSSAFLLMLPDTMRGSEINQLLQTCRRCDGRSLYFSRSVASVRLGEPTIVDASKLWQPVPDGRQRYWSAWPMVVAETRPIPNPDDDHKSWRAFETICLALAHVWRDQIPEDAEQLRERRYWNQIKWIASKESPFTVYDARPVFRGRMVDYAHHADKSNVLRGVNALISIRLDAESKSSELDCAAMAIGQSRHLGGGLLVPIDIPNDLITCSDAGEEGIPQWLS